MAIWLPLVLAGLVTGSQFVTNPEDLGKRFARAQKLLATGDFAGAQRMYEGVLEVSDGALLRASAVRVVVDEQAVGVQAAARYQLANMGRKQAQLWREEAALADSVEADSLAGLATASLRQAADRFAALRDEAGFELRETAAYLVVECFFEAEEYAAAAEAGEVLLRLFPEGRYAERTRYTLGWAWFYQAGVRRGGGGLWGVFAGRASGDAGGSGAVADGVGAGGVGAAMKRHWQRLRLLADSYDPAGMDDAEKRAVALAGLREGQSRRYAGGQSVDQARGYAEGAGAATRRRWRRTRRSAGTFRRSRIWPSRLGCGRRCWPRRRTGWMPVWRCIAMRLSRPSGRPFGRGCRPG